MAINVPGPYDVRIFYTTLVGTEILTHTQKLNCDMDADLGVGFPFSSWLVKQNGGGQLSLQSSVDQWIIYMRELFHTSTQFVTAELWKYVAGTYDASWRATYAIALSGLEAVFPTIAASQGVVTFRTRNGGIMRINLMEYIIGQAVTDPAPFGNGDISTLATYLLSSAGWVIGRDNGYPVAALNFLAGQNEKLFKLRFRT